MHQASFRDDVMNESWGEGTLSVSNFMLEYHRRSCEREDSYDW